MIRTAKVSAQLAGSRLDKAVLAVFDGLSRALVKKAIEERVIRVNGRVLSKGDVVAEGDELTIEESWLVPRDAPALPEPEKALNVCYKSEHVIVVDKPAHQPTAPLRADETGTLANALVGHFPELAGIGRNPREPGLVHRLDNDTSGLVLVGRTGAAVAVLVDALQNELITKRYLLWCSGEDLSDSGTIEIPLTNHPKDKRRVYPCIHPRDVMRYAPREAITHYRVIRRVGSLALVEADAPKAHRHQIRAHFAGIEHPLLGDVLYGGAEHAGLTRHALHASHISFGGSGVVEAFSVDSPLPPELQGIG